MHFAVSTTLFTILIVIVNLALLAGLIYLLVLAVRALRVYIHSKEARQQMNSVRRTLGEVIKAHRQRCQMTQEFVAESLGVSRQAVSKWEMGTSEPSTSNLMALAQLFGVTAEELLREVTGESEEKE